MPKKKAIQIAPKIFSNKLRSTGRFSLCRDKNKRDVVLEFDPQFGINKNKPLLNIRFVLS